MRGPLESSCPSLSGASGLHARLAALVHRDRRARRERKLRAVRLAPEVVRDVPVRDLRAARYALAPLNVLRVGLRPAVDVRADRRAADGTDRGGHVVAAAAADLV